MRLRALWPLALRVILFGVAVIVLVRLGAALDYWGLSYWLVVAAVCATIALSSRFADADIWFNGPELRRWLVALASALVLMGWGSGAARQETINAGSMERLARAIAQGGEPASLALQASDDQTLQRLSDRFPAQVASEFARRETAQARRAPAGGGVDTDSAIPVLQRVWYVFRQAIDFFRWLMHPRG